MVMAYDFFDTIVHRNCHPEIVLFQWAKRVSETVGYTVYPSRLYEQRKQIEHNEKKQGKEEIQYTELISNLYNSFDGFPISENDFFELCYRIELEEEIHHIYIDENMRSEIQRNYIEGNRIIVISDFYCGKDFISDILESIDLKKYISEIYISSDYNCRKSSGSLFSKVLELENITSDKIIMTGDNRHSDYEVPLSMDIKAVFRPFANKACFETRKTIEKKVSKLMRYKIKDNPLNCFAFDCLYFVSVLYRELISNNINTALFCSREGQLIKKFFDLYQKNKQVKIKTEYFYISRKAILLPSLKEIDKEKFELVFRQFSSLSISDFLKTISFNDEEIRDVLSSTNLSEDNSVDRDNSETLDILRNSALFQNIYNKKRLGQRELFLQYIAQLGIDIYKDMLTLVDIGWKGTIQDSIEAIISNISGSKKVRGYYLGLRVKEFRNVSYERKKGLLFSDANGKCKNYDLLERGYMFYERIFAADHGPVGGYYFSETERKILPQIDNNPQQLRLYDYINKFQEELVDAFCRILALFEHSQWEPFEFYNCMIKNSLKKQCLYLPRVWNVEKKARDLSQENFGDISKNDKVRKDKISKEQWKKRDYYFVDYSYRLFDKAHLKLLYPLAKLYCLLVYWSKHFSLEYEKE